MVRLVTGGTGFIGQHLLRQLARRDGSTFVMVRLASRERLEASTPRDGQRAEQEISVEAATMAYLMRGIHF